MSDFDFENERLEQGWTNDQIKSEEGGLGIIGLEQHEKKKIEIRRRPSNSVLSL